MRILNEISSVHLLMTTSHRIFSSQECRPTLSFVLASETGTSYFIQLFDRFQKAKFERLAWSAKAFEWLIFLLCDLDLLTGCAAYKAEGVGTLVIMMGLWKNGVFLNWYVNLTLISMARSEGRILFDIVLPEILGVRPNQHKHFFPFCIRSRYIYLPT